MKIKKTLLFLLSLLFLLPCCPPAAYTAAEHAAARPFREVYPMAADPDTSRFSENFSQSTVENGRIWIDKTVNTDSVTFYDVNGRPVSNVTAAPDEFLVTLSALSQSYSVETVVEPTDAVFILDVSGSMHSNNLGNQTRATVMVQALNSAVDKLMRANPANRVSVVAYGGYAQGTTNVTRLDKLLSLGHYELPNGNYFNIDNSRTPPQITPAPALSGQNAAVGSTTVAGGTPTQRGIYEGAKILMDNTDTTLDYVTEKGRVVTLTRRPALILLSDGEPTFGWGDYRVGAASTDTGYTSGNGIVSGGTLGLDLLTIASASYWKKQVGDHYYGQGGASPWFYTIGVGVTNDHERAVLDPINNVQKITIRYNSADYSLKTLLDSFIAGNTVRFPAPNKNSAALGLIDVENYGKYVTNYAYADGYYQANDQNALSGAFDAIAAQIISKGHYTTESDAAKPDFSGYLVISDILGEHMEFREPKGFILYGQNRYGQNLAMELQ
ncbi:MAG: VWA domain-containing protein, partial [Defluviitaleaceae bacterium]|nr:VWA domain-containing protein [Defluviitaleaceae bacterium]